MKTNFVNLRNKWQEKNFDKIEKLCKTLNLPYERGRSTNHQLSIFFSEEGRVPKFIISSCQTLAGAGFFEFRCPATGVQAYLKVSDIKKIILDNAQK